MRILFITYGVPFPPDSGFRMHDYNVIQTISESHSVLLLSLQEDPEERAHMEDLAPCCELVRAVAPKGRTMGGHGRRMVTSLARGWPAATGPFMCDEMLFEAGKILTERRVDILQIEHSFLAPYIDAVPPRSRVKTVLSFHNLGVRQYRRMVYLKTGIREKLLFLAKWLLMLRWEARVAARFDHCLTVSGVERYLLNSANPSLHVSVIENGVDANALRPLPDAREGHVLLFVGTMGYSPNVDAMLWFSSAILPRIQRAVPDVHLLIVGRCPSRDIRRLSGRGPITVTGAVPDVVPFYERSRVSVAPLRGGGGTRLKILESMALGRAVVSTPLGAEGLDVVHGDHIMIAREPGAFADRVIQLLTDHDRRRHMVRRARRFVEARHDRSVIGRKLAAVYETLAASGRP